MPSSRFGAEFATVDELGYWRPRLTGKVVRVRATYRTFIGIVESVCTWNEWYYSDPSRVGTSRRITDDRIVMMLRCEDAVETIWVRPEEITVWGEGRHAEQR